MTEPAATVSVVVVSRGRPQALLRCLAGLEQQFHPGFEVVVVADPSGIAAVAASPFGGRAKSVPFDQANISQARNLGIAHAAGDLIAFIDDDAVAEPSWLKSLILPFADPQVAAVGGYVLGRNGIKFQWKARTVDGTAATTDLALADQDWTLPDAGPGRAVRTEGTNMAVRRTVLVDLGGFDPAFAYYLDDTDLNIRLQERGLRTAIVPSALVHHGSDASDRRRDDRMPRDLTNIGTSSAVFLRKHAPRAIHRRHAEMWQEQRQRLIGHMVAGRCMPGDVARLLRGFDAGFASGLGRNRGRHNLPETEPPAFQRFASLPAGSVLIAGRAWRRRGLLRQARQLRNSRYVVTVMIFSRTALYHSIRFSAGIWQHRGGIFGRSARDGPLVRRTTFRQRVEEEKNKVARARLL